MVDCSETHDQRYPELERLIGQAVCEASFADKLVHTPHLVVDSAQYRARLSPHEQALVCSVVGTQSVAEFAATLFVRLYPHRARALGDELGLA